MKMQTFITIENRDKNGQLKSYKKEESHSFVRGFIDILQTQMSQDTLGGWTDTGSIARPPNANAGNFGCIAGAGTISYGIVVGSGTNPVAITDYALQTLITHGTGSGQLTYGTCTVGLPVTSGTSRQIAVSRSFTNASGSDVTVNEVGLYVRVVNVPYYICIDRTRNTFIVLSGTSSTVTYTIKVTV